MEETKTIILASSNKKEQAIINLKIKDDSEIKFFNFNNNQNKNFALGIKQGDGVKKVPLVIKNNLCKFKLPKDIDLQKSVLCAVVDVSNAFCPEIVLSGSNNSKTENGTIEEVFVAKKPDNTSVLYKEDSQEEINSLIEKNFQEDLNCAYFDACAKCKYREAFYSDNMQCFNERPDGVIDKVEKQSDKKEDGEFDKKDGESFEEEKNFYEQIKNQIDEMFSKNELDEVLPKIIANSKWVKIKYDSSNNFYVLGLIYNEDNSVVNFISYGVPSNNKDNPPEDLKDFAQWLPVENNENFTGYWLVYQNAVDGKTVKVDYM